MMKIAAIVPILSHVGERVSEKSGFFAHAIMQALFYEIGEINNSIVRGVVMNLSFSPYIFWGLIVLGIVLDVWLVLALGKHFKQRGVSKDIKSHVRYIQTEFPVWLIKQIREASRFIVHQVLTHFQSGLKSLTLILILALIPPFLVLRKDWFNYRAVLPSVLWFDNQRIYFPENFMVGILCIGLVLWLVSRRQTKPLFDGVPIQKTSCRENQLVWQRWVDRCE
jgi:hypothetical protein